MKVDKELDEVQLEIGALIAGAPFFKVLEKCDLIKKRDELLERQQELRIACDKFILKAKSNE